MLPYLPFQEDGVNEAMVLRDLPNLTEASFNENQDVIDDYYSNSLDRMVAKRYYNSKYLPIETDEDDGSNFTPNPPYIPTYVDHKIEGESKEDCIVRLAEIEGNVRRMWAVFNADRHAETVSKRYYPNLNPNLTKRDALKHTIWQALLSKYYWTISSKLKRYNFAKDMGDWNEDCGNNAIGTRHMDYQNNEIGRQIYQRLATFKKLLWMKVGINNPSNEDIYLEA